MVTTRQSDSRSQRTMEEMIVRWTARLAVAGYVLRLWVDVRSRNSNSNLQAARWWWTFGCGFFLLHVITAFHFIHHWNHSAAWESTARRTAEMTGWRSGMGLYINEAFLCLWIADTVQWWRNLNWPDQRWAYWIVQSIFAFLMVQATAVFGPPFWPPVTILVIVALAWQAFRHRSTNGGTPV